LKLQDLRPAEASRRERLSPSRMAHRIVVWATTEQQLTDTLCVSPLLSSFQTRRDRRLAQGTGRGQQLLCFGRDLYLSVMTNAEGGRLVGNVL